MLPLFSVLQQLLVNYVYGIKSLTDGGQPEMVPVCLGLVLLKVLVELPHDLGLAYGLVVHQGHVVELIHGDVGLKEY